MARVFMGSEGYHSPGESVKTSLGGIPAGRPLGRPPGAVPKNPLTRLRRKPIFSAGHPEVVTF